MKKIMALALALVLCFALFAGCGDSSSNTQNNTTPDNDTSDTTNNTTPVSDGKTYNLVVVNHDASTSMCEAYMETLFNAISEASGGRLTFTYYPGGSLLGSTEAPDGVKDGAADICWSATSFFSQRFPVSEFINLCANGITSARMGTDVYQQMYEEIPEVQAELGDWKVLALHACSYGPISTVGTKIEKPEDFKGLQIRTAGTIAAQYITALGATPVTIPTSDVYEGVSKGVFDGFTNDWHNIDCFKLYEPIDYCLDLPVSYTSCFVLMNKNSYDSLPADLQAIIDTYTGDYASDMAGYYWDSCRYWVADKMRENGVDVYEPSEELLAWAQSDEVVESIHQWYIDYLNGLGLDGQAIFDKCMEIVAENTEAHAGDWDNGAFTYTDWDVEAEGYNG